MFQLGLEISVPWVRFSVFHLFFRISPYISSPHFFNFLYAFEDVVSKQTSQNIPCKHPILHFFDGLANLRFKTHVLGKAFCLWGFTDTGEVFWLNDPSCLDHDHSIAMKNSRITIVIRNRRVKPPCHHKPWDLEHLTKGPRTATSWSSLESSLSLSSASSSWPTSLWFKTIKQILIYNHSASPLPAVQRPPYLIHPYSCAW